MRKLGRAFIGFLAGYVVYLVVIHVFLKVLEALGEGYPNTLDPFRWPFGAPFLVRPSEWRLVPVFDNVCSIVGALIILAVATWVYWAFGPRRKAKTLELLGRLFRILDKKLGSIQ